MFRSDRILAVDIGASKLVVAEFLAPKSGIPTLIDYGIGQLGVAPEETGDSSAYVVSALRELLRKHNFRPAPLLMTVSGHSVFPRFVKLPPVARDKLMQIIQYEAEQNVPFPINEVVWDYQLMESSEEGHTNCMLVAVKVETVTTLTDCVQAAGLEPEVVDAAPMALYNTVRYNYPDLEGCTLVLDIGARSTNLIFLEEGRIFSRSIPVAGNAITQEVAKELGLPAAEAEELKRTQSFVSFGGVTADTENEVADRVSRIVRNVITRLHAEVNRSINFYRSQQGGSAPSLVLLTGGTSVIPHMETFFREKLKTQVELLNPFTRVPVGGRATPERVGGDLQLLGEVTGLALRHGLKCPVEINLMPPALVDRKTFRRRQPFFAISAAGLVLMMLALWGYSLRMRDVRQQQLETVEAGIRGTQEAEGALAAMTKARQAVAAKADAVSRLVKRRTQWIETVSAMRDAMLEGMWVSQLVPVAQADGAIAHVDVTVSWFEDKVKLVTATNSAPIELFRDRLRKSSLFTDKTEIKALPIGSPDAYAREFTISIALKDPI